MIEQITKIALLGAGGMAQEIISFWAHKDIIDYLYDGTITENKTVMGYPVSSEFKPDSYYVMAVGYPETKQKIIDSIKYPIKLKSFYQYPYMSFLPDSVSIGDGSVMHNSSILTADIVVGKCSSINSMVTIGHNCRIGDLFHASPGVSISGNNTIGDRVFMGTNSCTKEKITICDDVIIGAGAVVVRDITEPGKYAGNPARKI